MAQYQARSGITSIAADKAVLFEHAAHVLLFIALQQNANSLCTPTLTMLDDFPADSEESEFEMHSAIRRLNG